MVRWSALVLVGCGIFGEPGLKTDVVNGRLLEGSSLCEYEQVAPELPPPDDSGAWLPDWERSPYLDCADGMISARHTLFESGAGRSEGFSVDVQLYQVLQPFSGGPSAEVLQVAQGIDDCEIVRRHQPKRPAERGEVSFHTVPEAAIVVDGWQRPLEDFDPESLSHTYSAWLAESELPQVVTEGGGEVALLIGEGGTAPAMELEHLFRMPVSIEVTAPDLHWGAEVPRADVPFAWTGASGEGTVQLSMLAQSTYHGQEYPTYEIDCELADDGAWVMPAAVLQQIPAGWAAWVQVERRDVAWVGTMNGQAIRVWASSAHTGANVQLGE